MNNSLLKLGVVGAGKMGQYHINILSNLNIVQLVGITDIDNILLNSLSIKYPNIKMFTDYNNLYDLVDAVVIASPTKTHYSITKSFLQNKKHVLLEKPICENEDEAKELIQIASNNNLIFHIGYIERFNGATSSAKEYITKPLLFEANRLNSPVLNKSFDTSVVLDLMTHDLDLILSFLDYKEPQDIFCSGKTFYSGYDDFASADLYFENNVQAHLVSSRNSLIKDRSLRITQDNSIIILDFANQETKIYKSSNIDLNTSDNLSIMTNKNNALQIEIEHFINCILMNQKSSVSLENEFINFSTILKVLNKLKEII